MAEGAASATKAAPGAGRRAAAIRQAPAPGAIPRRMLSQPGEAAERHAQARAARALRDAAPADSRSPRQVRCLPSGASPVTTLPPGAPPAIAAQARHGRPLPHASAADFGARLGADLGHVRIHDDAGAAALADAASARAFTLGSHVFFGRGEYQPGTPHGRALLAHELAHAAEPGYGPPRLLRQPKGEVVETADSDIQVIPVPAGRVSPERERFERLQVGSNAMDDAAKELAAFIGWDGDQEKNVYIGLSPRFFKVYNSRGDRLGRIDTKDSEKVTFRPGIYVPRPEGLVAVTVSTLDPRRRGLEPAPRGLPSSPIVDTPLTNEQKKAQEDERAKAKAEKREPKPVANATVLIDEMAKDPSALKALVEMVPDASIIVFVPSHRSTPGGGKGGGDQASPYATPIEGRADGQPPNFPPWPVKLEGPKLVPVDADPMFEAMVDWSANGNWNMASQVISQVGEDIHYRWELFNITEYANNQEAKAAGKKRPDDPAAPPRKTLDERIKEFTESKRGAGTDVTGMGGANREFAREFEDWWSDTKRAARRVANPAGDTVAERLSHLQGSMLALEMTPTSLLITAVRATFRLIADLFAGPRKQQEIPLGQKGIFLVRVITTPAVNEDTHGNPVIRPPSVDAKVVEVSEMDQAVTQSLDEPEQKLANLRAQVADAREAASRATSESEKSRLNGKADYLQSMFDEANRRFFGSPLVILQERWDLKKAELDAFRRARPAQTDYTLRQDLDRIHDQIEAYERHEKQRTEGASGLPPARVSASLISEVTGLQYPLLLAAGPMPMEDGRHRWMLSDVTSGDGKAYVGLGDKPSAAFGSALQQFGDQAAYGRGRIGVRTAGLGLEDGAPQQMFVDSAPADWALAMKRIDDLVTTLMALGLIVESAGTAAVWIGAAAAAARLIRRWEEGNLKPTAETFSDVLSVLGAVGAAGELAAGLRVQRFEGAFTVMKAGAATEEQLARAGELVAGARSLAASVKVANEVMGYAGLVWGDLSFIDNMLAIGEQERKGEITHAAAGRDRADAITSAIQNHMLFFVDKEIKGRQESKAERRHEQAPREPAPREAEPARREEVEEVKVTAGEEERPVTEAASAPAPAAERQATYGELLQVLPADLRGLLKFGDVEGDAADIKAPLDKDGLVGEITIHVGPETTPGMLRQHIETVRTMQKYQGFSGRIRKALTWIADIIGVKTLHPGDPEFKTKLEIDKLKPIVAQQMNAMEAMEPDAREVAEGKLDVLRSQLEEYMAALDIGELTPVGDVITVAARGVPKRHLKRYNELHAELRQYKPGSEKHSETRWEMYQLTGGTWEYPHWKSVYDAAVKNAPRANKIVEAERVRLGWTKSSAEVTIEMPQGADRRLDLANEATREGAEVKAYGSGTVPLNTDNIAEADRDAMLVDRRRWKITWIFIDCDPSSPLLEKLHKSGIIIEKRNSSESSSRLDYRLYPLLPARTRR